NTFVVFLSRIVGTIVDRVVFKTEQGVGPGYWIAVIVSQIIFGIIASMIVAWFSRQREFRADAGGARLAGASKMANALRRLQSQHQASQLPKEMSAMGIFGLSAGGFRRLFMTHPPLDERIAALQKPVIR
ncbi:MAG: M48 family metalloprotease, partial [Pseudomonadota bacterium]